MRGVVGENDMGCEPHQTRMTKEDHVKSRSPLGLARVQLNRYSLI